MKKVYFVPTEESEPQWWGTVFLIVILGYPGNDTCRYLHYRLLICNHYALNVDLLHHRLLLKRLRKVFLQWDSCRLLLLVKNYLVLLYSQ